MRAARFTTIFALCLTTSASLAGQQTARPPLAASDISAIAEILMFEDVRRFDEAAFKRLLASRHPEVRRRAVVALARIADADSRPVLLTARKDADPQVVASVAFAAGQLRDANAVEWLAATMSAPETPVDVAREAARSLGKMTAVPAARNALAAYLSAAPSTPETATAVGEALLAIGRFTTRADLAPILRWMTASDVEVRWRAAWALFRPRDPAAVPYLLTLSRDRSPDVRFWAVRGLVPPTAPGRAGGAAPAEQAAAEVASFDHAAASARLRDAVKDADRRVRTEALRALALHDDDESFAVVLAALDDDDSWLSVSAAEAMGRFTSRGDVIVPALTRAVASTRPLALRVTALPALTTVAPGAALEPAAELAASSVTVARNAGVQALRRLGDPGRERLEALGIDAAGRGQGGGGQGARGRGGARGGGGDDGGRGRGGAGAGATPPGEPRPMEEYRALVERWIVPDYTGAPRPRAIWQTPKGAIELELYPGDAPFGVEHFLELTESGAIVGTEFSRVVPNFVAQQQTIRGARRLRDEVSLHGLTRANLSWASSGLDTGRPGYTLASTPQPHNEGNFTALGRVVAGMDVVDRLELGDSVTAARMR